MLAYPGRSLKTGIRAVSFLKLRSEITGMSEARCQRAGKGGLSGFEAIFLK
jgi:hypothetical protein